MLKFTDYKYKVVVFDFVSAMGTYRKLKEQNFHSREKAIEFAVGESRKDRKVRLEQVCLVENW